MNSLRANITCDRPENGKNEEEAEVIEEEGDEEREKEKVEEEELCSCKIISEGEERSWVV